METTIHWKGREYLSRESCLITASDDEIKIDSAINGSYLEMDYHINYNIRTNSSWEVLAFSVTSQVNRRESRLSLESDGKGKWKAADGHEMTLFNGCIDIDISLTPFTNTLPINRLKLAVGRATEIKVLYLDLLNGETRPVRQKYTRVSEKAYLYENVPNDFEALITVDDQGLVVDYPGLFERAGD